MKLTCLTFIIVSVSFFAKAQEKAELIIINARIHTMDEAQPMAEAIAIAGHKIIGVGKQQVILKLKSAKTKIIDAKGNTVIPGLFDSHLHVIRGGRFYNTELRWDGVKTLKRALEMLKEQAQRTPEGQWVRVVGGWNEYQFEEKRLPTLQEINEATGDVPAFILYLYGKAWLNKAGLAKLKITGQTPNPQGGLIEKDIYGNATGLLVAEPNAFILYATLAKLPELSVAEKINSTLQYMTELNRLGVTAVMDAGGGFQNFPDDYKITDSLYRLGQITLRLPYFLFAQKKGTELQDYKKWIGMAQLHSDADKIDYHVQGGGENLVADAADFENFLFPRPDLPVTMESTLKPVIEELANNKWPFRLHATYNESITRDLDVIESVGKTYGVKNLIWFFDHAETVAEENLRRIKLLNGRIAIQHRLAYQGESFVRRYGKDAAVGAPPIKKMLQMGIRVGLGTDGTRVASYNPWIALYWITTGKTIGGNQQMAEENTLDRNTALTLITKGSWSLINEEKVKGQLTKGYAADLVMLSDDYFTVADEKIKDITSVLTIVNGKIVWGTGNYQMMAPARLPVIPEWSPVKYYGGYQVK